MTPVEFAATRLGKKMTEKWGWGVPEYELIARMMWDIREATDAAARDLDISQEPHDRRDRAAWHVMLDYASMILGPGAPISEVIHWDGTLKGLFEFRDDRMHDLFHCALMIQEPFDPGDRSPVPRS